MSTGLLIPNGVGHRKLGMFWHWCLDGNQGARELFDRHYSRHFYADGRSPKLFVGPGVKLVLITEAGDALFVWRKFKDASGQGGINCSVFRNEGTIQSSALILDAEYIAWKKWPEERLYTYVKASAIRSTNPGYCFKKAGWKPCGITKWNKLVILEKLPHSTPSPTASAALRT